MSLSQTPALIVNSNSKPEAETKPASPGPRNLRRILLLATFLFFVVAPSTISTAYLYFRAADQYHSNVAFSVRSEEINNPLEVLRAFTQVTVSSTPDIIILYDFIRSQPLVELIDARLDLATIFNRSDGDFIFSLGKDPTVETVLDYWDRMVSTSISTTSGVIELNVRAFSPEDSQAIALEILSASSELINELSRAARDDAMRFAGQNLAEAEQRLKKIRTKIREFRSQNQIIDPEANVASRMGVVSALQSRLASELVEKEIIRSYAPDDDLRIGSIDRRIAAIRRQIAAERNDESGQKIGERPLSAVIGEFEELLVDLEFSQNTYTAALVAEENARVEARRKSRYISVHIPPTLAEQSLYPRRWLLAGLIFACLFAAWSVLVLIYYNVRDRT